MKMPRLVYPRERPKIIIPKGFMMIQDTREQRPLFKPDIYIKEYGLKVGDYSIEGMEDKITIERKSIPDLFGSLGKGRKNFEKRIAKMKDMYWSAIMIEGCEDEVMKKQDYSSMNVNAIYHTLSSYEVDGVHIYFAKRKRDAQDWVLTRLTRFFTHIGRD